MWIRTGSFIAVLLLLQLTFTTPCSAQFLDSSWAQYYHWSGADVCKASALQANGTILIGGESGASTNRQARVACIGDTGNLIWSYEYGGPVRESCNAFLPLDDGFLFGGETASYGSGQTDFWIVRCSASGETLWTRTFGGSANERCYAMCASADSGIILAGTTTTFSTGSTQVWMVKMSDSGDSLWSRSFGGTGTDECYSIAPTADHGFLLAGSTTTYGAGGSDFWIVRTDSSGNSLWSRTFGGTNTEVCQSIVALAAGGFALAGYTSSFGGGSYDYWLVRMSDGGDSLWSRTYGRTGIDMAHAAVVDSFGHIAVAGESPLGGGSANFRLVLFSEAGDSLTTLRAGGANSDVCYSLLALPDHSFLMSGQTYSFGPSDGNFWVYRTTPLPTVPSPENLTISVRGDSLRLRWRSAADAIGYRVMGAPNANGPWQTVLLTTDTIAIVPVDSTAGFFSVITWW
jgi:hypothetical protein